MVGGKRGLSGDSRLGRRLNLAGVASAILAITMLTPAVASAAYTPSNGHGSSPSVLGIYTPATGTTLPREIRTSFPFKIQWINRFIAANNWTTISGSQLARTMVFQAPGSTSYIWGVPMLPSGTGRTQGTPCCGTSLASEATGSYDRYFRTLARTLVSLGQGNSVIRIGWEFNGDWMTWAANGQAANFIGAFRHIVSSMRSVSGGHFVFEWNPTFGDLHVGNLASYYPGDTYVDWVGLDFYDVQWGYYPGAAAQWDVIQHGPYGLDWLKNFATAHNKAVAIPEFGLGWGPSNAGAPVSNPGGPAQGGDDGYFIAQVGDWCNANGVVEATYWWQTGPLDSGANPNAQAAFAAHWH